MSCGFDSYHSKEVKQPIMRANRVTKRKRGYKGKKVSVDFPYTKQEARDLVEKRTEEGYLLGWTKGEKGLTLYLRYTGGGAPSRSKIERRKKPSREHTRGAKERWGANGDMGTYRRQTTKGRKTSVEARKEHVGGIVYRWVA